MQIWRQERNNVKMKFGLLNANGSFGNSSYGAPAFPTPKEVLAHIDRLGVARSLVWNIESRDGNCPWSNRRLLDEIARTPGPGIGWSPPSASRRS